MILGIGMDIAETARVKGSMDRFGESFLQRILLPEEKAYCLAHKEPALYVAARFAAKEAVSKAFGTGIGAQASPSPPDEAARRHSTHRHHDRLSQPCRRFVGAFRRAALDRDPLLSP